GGYLLEALDLAGKSLLDVGCGYGFIGRYLVERADCRVTGVDFQAHRARQPDSEDGRLKFVEGDCLRLPFAEAAFDVTLAVEMLHHLDPKDVPAALGEMCRVLRPGGALAVYEVNRFHPLILALSIFDASERHQLSMSVPRLASLLRPRFEEVRLRPLNYFLPTYKYSPPPFVERVRPLVNRLEDATEVKHLCMQYMILARGYKGPAR
ncbi:MAG TPA: class I SAM-dependent methyltransferase, partial [Pyrinomonadaceae bacterium]|nr:class I SAM-dependent methyltransferase [Pyrinomonadaceae bacterium]